MKKRIGSLLLVLVMLLFCTPTQVFAAEKLHFVSAYALENSLYVYADPKENDTGTLTVEVRINDRSTGQKEKPVSIVDKNKKVTYLFLIDYSGSMENVRGHVERVVSSIMKHDESAASVILATFGEMFQEVFSDGVDEKAVLAKLKEFKYSEQWTNPYDGVLQAYDYLEKQPRMAGEIVNLVLITDGEPAIKSEDKAELPKQMEEVKDRIDATSSVIFHTIGLQTWDEEAFDIFSTGMGLDVNIQSFGSERCGQEIAQFVNRLEMMEYNVAQFKDLPTWNLSISVFDSLDSTVHKTNWNNIQVLGSGYMPNTGTSGNSQSIVTTPEPTVAPTPTATPENPNVTGTPAPEELNPTETPEDPNVTGTPAPEEPNPTETPEDPNATGTPASEEPNPTETPEAPTPTIPPAPTGTPNPNVTKAIILSGVGVIVLLVVLLLVIILLKRKGGSSAPSSGNSIQMRLVMLSGTCQNKKDMLYLQDELWIGSSKKCDIVLNDADIDAKNSRIFMRDGMIYIEDVNSTAGTYLEGMRIVTVNRLRSGDTISIGNTSFRLMF